MQVLLITVGVWLCLTLGAVAWLIGLNLIRQRQVLDKMTVYLERQDKLGTELCRINGKILRAVSSPLPYSVEDETIQTHRFNGH